MSTSTSRQDHTQLRLGRKPAYPGDYPVRTRKSSSVEQLRYRFKEVLMAYLARDAPALREELRSLSDEALLLARSDFGF